MLPSHALFFSISMSLKVTEIFKELQEMWQGGEFLRMLSGLSA